MNHPEPEARTQQHLALFVVIIGIVAVAAVMLWERRSQPLEPPASPQRTAPVAASSAEFEPLFSAVGIRRPVEPAAAPEFSLLSLDGQSVQLRQFKGKLLVLNFWATWCAPCLHEMPSMERLHQSFKATEFALLAVSMDRQGEEVAKPYVDNLKLTFPVLLDRTQEVSRQYSVRGLPTTYLIDPDGRLIGVAVGARDWDRTEAKALIAGLLRQHLPSSDHAEHALKPQLPGSSGTQ
jgi:peroxiredoxin